MAPAGQDLTSLTLEGEGSIVLKRHPRAKRLMVLAATQIDGPAGRTAALALTMLPLERRFELLYQERGALDVDLQQIPLLGAGTVGALFHDQRFPFGGCVPRPDCCAGKPDLCGRRFPRCHFRPRRGLCKQPWRKSRRRASSQLLRTRTRHREPSRRSRC